MAFDGTEGSAVSLETASGMTARYRSEHPNETVAHFFGKDILAQILAQEGCMGIRIYYGMGEDGQKELVLVGVDAHEEDLTDLVADISSPCQTPPCGKPNALNS